VSDPGDRGQITPVQAAAAGGVIGLIYAVVLVATGDVAPGLVGGVLLAVLIFLVIQRVQAFYALKRQRSTRREPPPG
jgi:hypothetical protein